jgi:hypothetical protein
MKAKQTYFVQRPEEAVQHLTSDQLARRWAMSGGSLKNLGWAGRGPRFLKLGRRVLYRLEDVEAYERKSLSPPLRD